MNAKKFVLSLALALLAAVLVAGGIISYPYSMWQPRIRVYNASEGKYALIRPEEIALSSREIKAKYPEYVHKFRKLYRFEKEKDLDEYVDTAARAATLYIVDNELASYEAFKQGSFPPYAVIAVPDTRLSSLMIGIAILTGIVAMVFVAWARLRPGVRRKGVPLS